MVRLVTLLSVLSACAWSQSGPVREMSAAAIIGQLMPGFYNGYLYSCEPRHIITLFGPDGQIILTLPIQGRGNGGASIASLAIDSDRTLAVGWSELHDAGIDIRDISGNLIRSINTGRFVPAHVSFGADHSLWAFGWQRAATDPRRPDKEDYYTVRKYSSEGNEVGAYIQRSLFPHGLEPGMTHWQERRITVTPDRVGIEAVSGMISNQLEWVELDLNGNLIGRWRLDPEKMYPRIAFTSDNRVYVQGRGTMTSRRVLRLNRSNGEWEPVNTPNAELYGSDGDKLVFAEWPDGIMHMSWYSQP